MIQDQIGVIGYIATNIATLPIKKYNSNDNVVLHSEIKVVSPMKAK